MARSEKYRRFAQACMEMARTTHDVQVRATLLQMAQSGFAWQKTTQATIQATIRQIRLDRFLRGPFIGLVSQLPPSLSHFFEHSAVLFFGFGFFS